MGTSEESSIRPISSINRVTIHILKRMLLESRQRNSSSSTILQNAYISLKACPVPFQDIEELNQLSGFESEAFRKEVQRKLETWCMEHGRKLSNSKVNNIAQSSNHQSTSTKPKARAVQRTLNNWTEGESTTVSSSSKQAKDVDKSKSKKKTTNSAPVKQYIPQHRSGTHGIMVALFGLTPNQIDDDNDEGENNSTEYYFSKATIISYAQTFSDVKYIPAKGPSHFGTSSFAFNSAWSGMKTLINRGYVFRKGNPARFGLSSVGWKIGKCCAEKEKDVSSGCFTAAEPPLQERSIEKSKSKQKVSNDQESTENNDIHVREEDTVDTNIRPTPPMENPTKITQKLKKSKERVCTSQRELLDTSSADEDMEETEKENETVFANKASEPLQSIMDEIRNSEKESISKKVPPSDSIIKSNHSKRNVIDLISSDDIDMMKENIENLAHKQHPEPLSPLQGRQRRRRIS